MPMAASPPTRASARNFLVASSTMIPDQQLTVANAVREGARLQAVTTAGIIRELSLRSHALKDDSLHGRMQLHCHNNALDCSRFLSLPGPAPTGRDLRSGEHHPTFRSYASIS